jgi:hypothetical protein
MIDSPRTVGRPTSRPAASKAANPPSEQDEAREEALAEQQAQFDYDMAERSELQREANVLRDMMLEQLKNDDEALKKYIAMI